MSNRPAGPDNQFIGEGQGHAPDRPKTKSVFQSIAEDCNRNTSGVHDAINNARDLLVNLRGQVPQPGNETTKGLEAAPDLTDLGAVSDAQNKLHGAVNELHDVMNDLRSTLGY